MTDKEKKVGNALTFLFLVIKVNYLNDTGGSRTAREAWTTLEKMHLKFELAARAATGTMLTSRNATSSQLPETRCFSWRGTERFRVPTGNLQPNQRCVICIFMTRTFKSVQKVPKDFPNLPSYLLKPPEKKKNPGNERNVAQAKQLALQCRLLMRFRVKMRKTRRPFAAQILRKSL